MGLLSKYFFLCFFVFAKSLYLFSWQHKESSPLRRKRRAAAVEGVIYGDGGNGNKDKPKGCAGALCTAYWVPLDVTGDILC